MCTRSFAPAPACIVFAITGCAGSHATSTALGSGGNKTTNDSATNTSVGGGTPSPLGGSNAVASSDAGGPTSGGGGPTSAVTTGLATSSDGSQAPNTSSSATGSGGSGGVASTTGTVTMATGGASSLTSAGGASTGTSGVAGGGGSGGTGEFELDWVDEFDTLDESRWTRMTHTWDGNLAQFATETVSVDSGILRLSLLPAPAGSEKPYLGVEYRSIDTVQFGKVEARIRFAKGSAVVSSLVLLYTPWPPDDWNELDIECLGNTTDQVQFNHMINIPPADPATEHLQFPALTSLGFDPTADFHDYGVEWTPGLARFLVDGNVVYEATEEMQRMVLPQNILLTIWASDASDWAGPVDGTTAPTYAEYDWIHVYRYTGSNG